jgi:hypothetical protein
VHDEIFASKYDGNGYHVLVFPRSGNGAMTPRRTIDSSALTGLMWLAVDNEHDELVALNWAAPNTIVAFPLDANGTVATKRTMNLAGGLTVIPYSLVVDPAHDETLVTTQQNIEAYSRIATGDATPKRTITASGLFPTGLALDRGRDQIFAVNDAWHAGILVFPRIADGPTVPLRTIAGPATFLYQPPYGWGDFAPAYITICH